jgi:hypothetical protein
MIDSEELAICRRRGHRLETSGSQGWTPCQQCGTWVRAIPQIEERETEPANAEELAICRRRGHEGHLSWEWKPCKSCGLELREVRNPEERDDEPPEDELDPLISLRRSINSRRAHG